MAKAKRFTEQFSLVSTPTHKEIIDVVTEAMKIDKAPIVRRAMDDLAGTVDGELRPGDTVEAAAKRVILALTPAPATAAEPEEAVV